MHMVRSGSPAVRAVVKDEIVRIFSREVHHIHEVMPNRLRLVRIARYDEMISENRIWVYLNVIMPVLSSFEFDMELLSRTVSDAQKARALGQRRGIHLSRSRCDACRIILNLTLYAIGSQLFDLSLLQCAEIT